MKETTDYSDPLFTLVFYSKMDTELSKHLQITSRFTEAEAYNEAGEELDVVLKFLEDEGKTLAPLQNVLLWQPSMNCGHFMILAMAATNRMWLVAKTEFSLLLHRLRRAS